jgi:hypothetical protein
VKSLSSGFGNTMTSTLWRFVEQAHAGRPIVALVTGHPHPTGAKLISIPHRRAQLAIIVCLSGPEAQRQYNPRSWRSHHGASDHSSLPTWL